VFFSFFVDGWLSCREDIDGSSFFFWDWQLVRFYSPKFSLPRRVFPRDVGEWMVLDVVVL